MPVPEVKFLLPPLVEPLELLVPELEVRVPPLLLLPALELRVEVPLELWLVPELEV